MGKKDDFLSDLLGTRRRSAASDTHHDKIAGKAPGNPANDRDDTSDLLGGLTAKAQPHLQEKSPTGLTPLDLLTLPADQRKIVNWLSRAKQATVEEIQAALNMEREAVVRTLKQLVESGFLNEALANDTIVYRVQFRGKVRRGPVGLPGEIWARVDLDHVTFLKSLSLFRGLNDDQVRDIANTLTERRYQRDEVILWQGNVSEHVFFIKSGIVGITRFSAQNKDRKALAYLKQGDILGEYGILPEQGGVASATATALSTVDALLFKRADFMNLLSKYSSVAIELARILVQRLIATDSHFSSAMGTRVVLVIGAGSSVGGTTIGNMMALTLCKATQKKTVYTEQPEPHRLMPVFNVSPGVESVRHVGGYDVILAGGSTGLPASVRATLVFEQLLNNYENIVIGLPSWADEIISYLIGYANQIVVVATPDLESLQKLSQVREMLKTLVHPEKVGVFYVMNRTESEHNDITVTGRYDFDLPHTKALPSAASLQPGTLPEAFDRFTATLADRLGRTNQVSIYIPTTVDVNQAADTTAYVERTLAFLGQRFGGATTNQARGVWNSDDSGLVGEDIHIVRSYATQTDLDRYLQEILDYVERLKVELRQEAMALEINQKLMLI